MSNIDYIFYGSTMISLPIGLLCSITISSASPHILPYFSGKFHPNNLGRTNR